MLRDPRVEEAQAQEQGAKCSWSSRLWIRMERWLGQEWDRYFSPRESAPVKNYLFLPRLDQTLSSSTIFRYLPPDQFWQVCAEDVILVNQADSREVRERLVGRGKEQQKLVLLVDSTPYRATVHTANFWQPWSLFVRPTKEGKPEASTEMNIDHEKDFLETLREGRSGEMGEPNQAGEQTKRKWQILRQVDLQSNSYLDLLVDAEGEMAAPWSVGPMGSRFEVWVMTWGTVRPQMVECWSVFPTWPSRSEAGSGVAAGASGPLLARFLRTGKGEVVAGQEYDIAWTGGRSEGEFGLQEWSASRGGEIVGVTHFNQVVTSSEEWHRASVAEGSETYALWWRPSPSQDWILLSQACQSIRPLPRVDFLSGQNLDDLTRGQTIDLAGHGFPAQSMVRVLVRQFGRQTLVKELVGKSEWEVSVDPRALNLSRGRVSLTVEYPCPWSSRSELPSTWKMVKAMEREFTVK